MTSDVWPPAFAEYAPRVVPAPTERAIRYGALEHHEQQLARCAHDDAAFEQLSADSVDVRGDVVVLRQGGREVARYRWAMGRGGLRFEVVP